MDNETAKKSKKRSRSLIPDEKKTRSLQKRSNSKHTTENSIVENGQVENSVANKQSNDKKKQAVAKSGEKDKENVVFGGATNIFGLSGTGKEFFNENVVPLSIIEEQKSLLQNCQIIIFTNLASLTDALFWALKSVSSENMKVTEICCLNCTNLSDGAICCIVDYFKNLKKVQFDGCSKVTERSAILLSSKVSKISMKNTNVKLITNDMLGSLEKFDFSGCPIQRCLTLITKVNPSTTKCYKIVTLVDWKSEKSKDANRHRKVSFKATLVEDKLMNIFSCDYSLGHIFVTPGTIVVGLSEKLEHKEEALSLATHYGFGSPCVVIGDKNAELFTRRLRTKITGKILNNLHFVDQQMYSNLWKNFYLLSNQQPNETKNVAAEQIVDFNSEVFRNAIKFVDDKFPELNNNLVGVNEIVNEIKSNKSKVLPITNEYVVHLLERQGHVVRLCNSQTLAFCLAETFVDTINEFFNFKNTEKSLKIIPWLDESIVVAKPYSIVAYLTNISESRDQAANIFDNLLKKGLFININRPWLNKISTPAVIFPTFLSHLPPIDEKTLFAKYPSEAEQEIFAKFAFCVRPPFSFNIKLLQLLCRIGHPVAMWQNGILFHFGFVEAYVSFSTENGENLLYVCLRTVNFDENEKLVWKENNGFENIVTVLRQSFRLIRQFVIVTTLECDLYVEEFIRCKKCSSQQKEHYFPMFSGDASSFVQVFSGSAEAGIFQCENTVYSLEDFGYGFPPLGCDKHGKFENEISPSKCSLCSEELGNYSVAWCNSCGQCAECTLLLMKQSFCLNAVDLSQKCEFDSNARIFAYKTGRPFIVEFQCSNSSNFDIVALKNLEKIHLSLMKDNRFHSPLSNCSRVGEAISLSAQKKNSSTFVTIHSAILTNKIEIPEEESVTFYLIFYERETSVSVFSNEPLKTKTISLEIGMRLEAKDRKNPTLLCVATITNFDKDGKVQIHFDGWSNNYDYYATIDDADLHPIGFCEHDNYKLEVPGSQAADDDRTEFTWPKYLARYMYQQVPHKFFRPEQNKGSLELNTIMDEEQGNNANLNRMMEIGMKLEAKLKNSEDNFGVASVKSVKKDVITISFDGLEENEDIVCDRYDKALHPIGFCQSLGYVLFKENKEQTNFDWLNYLVMTMSKPVPYEYFSLNQTLSVNKHTVFAFFNELSNRSQCNETLSVSVCGHIFASQATTTLVNKVHELSLDSEKGFACVFGLLPTFKTVSDVLYPKLNLAYKYETDEQNVCTFVISSDVIKPFLEKDRSRSELDSVSERLIVSCLLENSLKRMWSVIKRKPGECNELEFLKRCRKDFATCLSLLVRTRVETATSVSELFPNLVDVNKDQVCESIIRYLYFYLYKLIALTFDDGKNQTEFEEHKQEKIGMKKSVKIALCDEIAKDSGTKILSRKFEIRDGMNFRQQLEQYETSDQTKSIVSCVIDHSFDRSLYQSIVDKSLELSEISLTNCRLTNFDFPDCDLMKILLKLNLSYNPLKQIPSSIFELTNLRDLRLAACGLVEHFPIEMLQLKRLTVLDLSLNFFKNPLPDYIVQLRRLHKLHLSAVPYFTTDNLPVTLETFANFCQRYCLPSFEGVSKENLNDKLSQLTGITSINVKFEEDLATVNRLINREAPRFESASSCGNAESGHGFPMILCRMKTLSVLSLSYHNISEVPADLENLNAIEELTFLCCPYLERISERLALLQLINKIELQYCTALKNIPPEILEKGSTYIIGHLRRELAGSSDCKRTKLMMVGLGGAGKSTLVQMLIGENTHARYEPLEVTDGIEITEYTWKIDEEAIVFSIWDFAGQSVYYHTHQFFLSNRAIYLLLWNSRLGYEHSGMEFWLSSIACHAPEAPVFVIATFADLIDKVNLPKDELQTSFPQIVSFERVSCITGLGMDEFRERLEKMALSQSYMNKQVAAVNLQLEKFILQRREETPIIDFSELESHAVKLGMVQTAEVRTAATFLNDLGSIQYFSNEFLRDKVVISPQWLVDVMACVVTVKSSVIEDGMFKEEDINKIWEKYPEELRPWLLKLTEEYDLTFTLPPPNEKLHVVPCLLPEEEPKITWRKNTDKSTKEIRMDYKFDYLPPGLFNRIQARLCQFSNESTIWKNGSLLNKNNHVALIRQTKDKGLALRVQGLRPENVMFFMHEVKLICTPVVIITIINESFKGVSYEILIQCPDCVIASVADAHMFSSSLITSATKLKAPILQCLKSFHMCSLNTLHSALPPNSLVDYEQHLLKTMQEMNELRSSVTCDVGMLVCSENIHQRDQLCPTKIAQDLKTHNVRVELIRPNSNMKLEDLVMKLVNSKLLIVCMSDEFCKNQMCTDLLTYVQQSHKQIVIAIVGRGNEWKLNSAGMLLGSELYVDFQKSDIYDLKLKDLLSRISNKKSQPENVDFPPVFFSYCWANSHDAVKKFHKSGRADLGEVDPRDICEYLQSKKIKCWIDYHMTGQKALFEEIAEALRNAQLLVACVSDDYLESQNCLREFHFAVGTLKLPSILCIVGTGDKWQESELTLLAYKSPRIDFRKKNDIAKNALCDIVKQNLAKKSIGEESRSAATPDADDTNGYDEYLELCELMRRRFLAQICQIDSKVRSGIIGLKKPYPRLMFLDVRSNDPDLEGCRHRSLVEFAMSKFCLKLFCEHEGVKTNAFKDCLINL